MERKVVVARTKATRCTFNCPELDSPPEIFTLDPDGDLHLIVGHNECIVNPGTVRKDSNGNTVLITHTSKLEVTIIENNESGDGDGSTSGNSRSEDNEEDDDGATTSELNNGLVDCRWHKHKTAVEYVVCSKTLCRSSPFFKGLLYGSFSESKKPESGDQWTVHLPEDDPAPMETILSISHGAFQHVPIGALLSTNGLYQLTALSDKYDLTHLLRPFALGWISDPKRTDFHGWTDTKEVAQLLWCAWELGDERVMEECIDQISSHCFLDDEEQLVSDINTAWDPWIVFQDILDPPGIIEIIRKRRIEMIEAQLMPLRTGIEAAANYHGPLGCGNSMCKTICTGSIIQHIAQQGLWPIPGAKDYRSSPSRLEYDLSAPHFHSKELGPRHERCIKKCKKELRLERDAPRGKLILPEFVQNHLSAQREKSGLPDPTRCL